MAKLTVTQGPNVGDSFPLTKKIVTLGRDEACFVRIDREGVSRNHAQICREGEGWVLNVSRVSAAMPALLAELERQGARLDTLATRQPTLDDVFLHLTGRALRDE